MSKEIVTYRFLSVRKNPSFSFIANDIPSVSFKFKLHENGEDLEFWWAIHNPNHDTTPFRKKKAKRILDERSEEGSSSIYYIGTTYNPRLSLLDNAVVAIRTLMDDKDYLEDHVDECLVVRLKTLWKRVNQIETYKEMVKPKRTIIDCEHMCYFHQKVVRKVKLLHEWLKFQYHTKIGIYL